VLGRGARLGSLARAGEPRRAADPPRGPRGRGARKRSAPRRRLRSLFSLPPHWQPYRPAIVLGVLFAGSLAWRIAT
jgi:hypothetical protein